MSIMDMLQSEAALTAAVTCIGAVWTLFKGRHGLAHKRRRLRERLKRLKRRLKPPMANMCALESNPNGSLTLRNNEGAACTRTRHCDCAAGASTSSGNWARLHRLVDRAAGQKLKARR